MTDPRIGEEVNSICFRRNIRRWRAVKGEDDVVLLGKSVSRWHRVELLGGCDEYVFRFAQKIAIEGSPGSGCLYPGDNIIVSDGPGFHRRCVIMRIYEWDEDAAVEDEEETEDVS